MCTVALQICSKIQHHLFPGVVFALRGADHTTKYRSLRGGTDYTHSVYYMTKVDNACRDSCAKSIGAGIPCLGVKKA